MTAGTAGMVDEEETSSEERTQPPSSTNNIDGAASPNAMDIDTPPPPQPASAGSNGARNIPVEPLTQGVARRRCEWRQLGHARQRSRQWREGAGAVQSQRRRVRPAVEKAVNEGIAVVGYDRADRGSRRPSISPSTMSRSARMMAREVQKAKPEGNYVFIKGSSSDPNANFLLSGLDRGAEARHRRRQDQECRRSLHRWLAAGQRPAQHGADPDATRTRSTRSSPPMTARVVAPSRAGSAGAGGLRAVSGQDADRAQLNRVALGTADRDDLEGCARARAERR